MSSKKKTGRAGEAEMGALHGRFAQALADKLGSGDYNAADLSVIRQFLKDNGISCDPETSDAMQSIVVGLPTSDELDDMAVLGREQ